MEDSTYEALYSGVYVFIFIIALSASIFLFKTVNDIADQSYRYGEQVSDPSLIVDASANQYRVINGAEVLSYYYNYVKKDLYGTGTTSGQAGKYDVVIEFDNRLRDGSANYQQASKIVSDNGDKYVMIYAGKNGTKDKIRIIKDDAKANLVY